MHLATCKPFPPARPAAALPTQPSLAISQVPSPKSQVCQSASPPCRFSNSTSRLDLTCRASIQHTAPLGSLSSLPASSLLSHACVCILQFAPEPEPVPEASDTNLLSLQPVLSYLPKDRLSVSRNTHYRSNRTTTLAPFPAVLLPPGHFSTFDVRPFDDPTCCVQIHRREPQKSGQGQAHGQGQVRANQSVLFTSCEHRLTTLPHTRSRQAISRHVIPQLPRTLTLGPKTSQLN